jgi:hypothetical protein
MRYAVLSMLLVITSAAPSLAQRSRLITEEEKPPAQWGVTFAFTPRWELPGNLSGLIARDSSAVTDANGKPTVHGNDWSIGIARGRASGHEWGLSFTRQRLDSGSTITQTFEATCGTGTGTCLYGQRLALTDVSVIGPEIHYYVPFLRINNRVGFGVNLAAGGGRFIGTAAVDRFEDTPVGAPGEHVEGPVSEIVEGVYYGEPWTWFGRVEPGVAIMATRQLRIHAGLGFHFPGWTYFGLRTTYFFPRATP